MRRFRPTILVVMIDAAGQLYPSPFRQRGGPDCQDGRAQLRPAAYSLGFPYVVLNGIIDERRDWRTLWRPGMPCRIACRYATVMNVWCPMFTGYIRPSPGGSVAFLTIPDFKLGLS